MRISDTATLRSAKPSISGLRLSRPARRIAARQARSRIVSQRCPSRVLSSTCIASAAGAAMKSGRAEKSFSRTAACTVSVGTVPPGRKTLRGSAPVTAHLIAAFRLLKSVGYSSTLNGVRSGVSSRMSAQVFSVSAASTASAGLPLPVSQPLSPSARRQSAGVLHAISRSMSCCVKSCVSRALMRATA